MFAQLKDAKWETGMEFLVDIVDHLNELCVDSSGKRVHLCSDKGFQNNPAFVLKTSLGSLFTQ
jgi:alpha-D-ribose 1-methylphosphonate 5-phosphate C-P lyase